MTTHTGTTASAEPRRRTRHRLAASMIVLLALALVSLMAFFDTTRVQTPKALRHVTFGAPLGWLTQNQSLDPPLPYDIRFASVWENPTSIELAPFLVDLAIVGLVLIVCYRGLQSVRHARNRGGSRRRA